MGEEVPVILLSEEVRVALPEEGIPRLLGRDLAPKYKKRVYTPKLSTVYDVPVEGKLQILLSIHRGMGVWCNPWAVQ